MWRLLEGQRRGWLEQLVLWLFRLSVDSEDPGEERWEQIRQCDSRKSAPTALKTAKATKIILPLEVQLIRRGAEQKGKPTYRSYSSIPIEHSSGPRAAQSEAGWRDKMVGNRRGVLGKQTSQRAHRLDAKHIIAALSFGLRKRDAMNI